MNIEDTDFPQKKRKGPGRQKEEFNILPGIDATPIDRYVVFGSLVIHKPNLFRENRLSVKYKVGLGSVHKFPTRKISDDFRDLIKTIIDEHKIHHGLLAKLSDDEKDLFYNLIRRAKLDTKLGLDGYRSNEQDKLFKRFELLKGQVLAGNNNKQILQELKGLVIKFMNDGTISKAEGSSILIELISLI